MIEQVQAVGMPDDQEYDNSPWTDEEIDQLRAEACEMLDGYGIRSTRRVSS
jgi:hypothetical protein